jgi:alcohol dehydrogenase class IV
MPPTLPACLSLPPLTFCGRGASARLAGEARAFGPRGLVVCSRSLLGAGLRERLGFGEADEAIRFVPHSGGEPTLDQLRHLLNEARAFRPDWVLAAGGGSVLDVAKAAAGLFDAPLTPEAYHDGAPLPASRMPFLAAPATAGTGSEATTVSVLTNARTGVKKSIRHASHMARVVALDADLLDACPRPVLAASGMDAFVQAVESFLSRYATEITQAWSLQAVRLLGANLTESFRQGPAGARGEALMEGSYLAGLALSNARLGLVHGLAHPLGARYHVAHGVCCAVCLPPVLAFNRDAAAGAYARLSEAAGADIEAFSVALLRDLHIASPFAGQPLVDEAGIVEETLASGSTAANPRPVTAGDVSAVLRRIFPALAHGAGV